MAHDVFISYSREDADTMHKVEAGLQAAGLIIWTDRGIYPGSPSWKTEIEQAIRDAGCVVVLFSPSAVESRWVRAELDYADAQKKPIYPLLVRGDQSNAVPFGFTSYQRIDLRDPHRLKSGLEQLISTLKGQDTTAPVTPVHTSTPKPARSRPYARDLVLLGTILIVLAGLVGILLVNNKPPLSVTPTAIVSSGIVPTSLPTMPPFVLPDGYKKVEGEKVVIAVPTGWASDVDQTLIENTFMVYGGKDAQSRDLMQTVLDGLDIYAVDMLHIQGIAVSIEDTGIALTYDILAERQRSLYTTFDANGTFINHGLVDTPAGTMLFTDSISSDNATSLMDYALIRGSLIYNIYLNGRVSDRDKLLQTGETIAQSFRVKG